jgi:hypothetical protein
VLSLVESPLHGFLKKLGMAFLVNQGCFIVDTEVPLTMLGQRRLHDLDEHHVIDVCGVGERFFAAEGEPSPDGQGLESRGLELTHNILRGIEVKISRSDFRNGFVCSGCNYNYLLIPMRLVPPSALPRGVGLIEYNKHKFSVEPKDDGTYGLRGLRVVRNLSFKRIRHHQVDNATSYMARRALGDRMGALLDDLMQSSPR